MSDLCLAIYQADAQPERIDNIVYLQVRAGSTAEVVRRITRLECCLAAWKEALLSQSSQERVPS
jgi:hypothetical protein